MVNGEISLLSRNPFAQNARGNADENLTSVLVEEIPSLAEELEFCGSHSIGSTRKFSILLKKEGNKYWVELSESLNGFKFVKYSEDDRSLLVEYSGKFDLLPIREMNRLASPRKHISRASSGLGNRRNVPVMSDEKPARRRAIIPRNKRPPKILPSTPLFPKKIPSPPQRV